MFRPLLVCLLAWLSFAGLAAAQDAKLEKVAAPAPADAVAAEIASLLDSSGYKVAKGAQTVIEFWPTKEWPVETDAKTGGEVLYPLTPGQLVGVARYSRKGTDFRDQDIPAGVYVVRYAQQPVDGAHVGTSPTRDFFALLPAGKDRSPAALDYKTLIATSKQTTGTEHPAILSLQRAEGGETEPAVRHDADHDWTILRFTGKIKQGGANKDVPVELVVAGKAAEL
jgi:hypothetical protein